MKIRAFYYLAATWFCLAFADAYIPPEVKQRWKDVGYTKDDAMVVIDKCAETGYTSEEEGELFYAIKFIDRNANQIYRGLEVKEALMDQILGSWELRLACNSDKDADFYPHPEFRAFAMAFSFIAKDYFGKGIAPDTNYCFVSIGGPSTRNIQTRQVYMNYEDYYINGAQVPGWDLSYYIRGWKRENVSSERKRPKLAFTVVAVSDTAMVVRGSKTGGLAVFRRIPDDMGRPAGFV